MLDIYVIMYYNVVTKGVVNMDLLDRLRILMDKHGDKNSSLAKKSGIPYTTIDGLFKRGWEKAQISTIQKICNYYGVSLDYMVFGENKLSPEALLVAAAYDAMSDYGKSIIDCVVSNDKEWKVVKRLEIIEGAHDSEIYARYNAALERAELMAEQNQAGE